MCMTDGRTDGRTDRRMYVLHAEVLTTTAGRYVFAAVSTMLSQFDVDEECIFGSCKVPI